MTVIIHYNLTRRAFRLSIDAGKLGYSWRNIKKLWKTSRRPRKLIQKLLTLIRISRKLRREWVRRVPGRRTRQGPRRRWVRPMRNLRRETMKERSHIIRRYHGIHSVLAPLRLSNIFLGYGAWPRGGHVPGQQGKCLPQTQQVGGGWERLHWCSQTWPESLEGEQRIRKTEWQNDLTKFLN